MKIKDLKKILNKYNDETDVIIHTSSYCSNTGAENHYINKPIIKTCLFDEYETKIKNDTLCKDIRFKLHISDCIDDLNDVLIITAKD